MTLPVCRQPAYKPEAQSLPGLQRGAVIFMKKSKSLKKAKKSPVSRRIATHQRSAQARKQAWRDTRGGGR
jgi:hypothetical protein